jgi:hypothetical protein
LRRGFAHCWHQPIIPQVRKIDVCGRMKYGARWYEKGKWKTEENLLTHIVNTINSNGKWDVAEYAKETAATKAEGGVGRGERTPWPGL